MKASLVHSSHVSVAHSLAAARIDRYLLERTAGSGLQEPRRSVRTRVRPVITISRTLGVPAEEIAARLARDLGFHVFDREVLEAVAQDAHLAGRIIESLDTGKQSALDAWIRGCLGLFHPILDPRGFRHMVCRVIRGISLHGSAVIIGRGANFILRGGDAFRVRLTAPVDLRVRAVMAAEGSGLAPAEARRRIRQHNDERRKFMKKHFRADIDAPAAYDAVFNLRSLEPDLAAGLIEDIYRRTFGEQEGGR